jgi:hypothetical protein
MRPVFILTEFQRFRLERGKRRYIYEVLSVSLPEDPFAIILRLCQVCCQNGVAALTLNELMWKIFTRESL